MGGTAIAISIYNAMTLRQVNEVVKTTDLLPQAPSPTGLVILCDRLII